MRRRSCTNSAGGSRRKGIASLRDSAWESGAPCLTARWLIWTTLGKRNDEDIVVRPFPQVATGGASLNDQWAHYRKALIEQAGIAIFVFGNKRDSSGNIVPSDGVRKEFDLCVAGRVRPLPIGTTGFMAEELWKEVWGAFTTFYPDADAAFRGEFGKLGDPSKTPGELLASVQTLINTFRKPDNGKTRLLCFSLPERD